MDSNLWFELFENPRDRFFDGSNALKILLDDNPLLESIEKKGMTVDEV